MRLATITAIEKNITYSEQAYSELKRLIILNELKAGTVLNERDVSERLSISRTPVRDALQMLETKGWAIRCGKNKIVAPLTEKTIQEIFEIRKSLELLSVDLAKDKMTEKDLDYFNSLIDKLGAIRDETARKGGVNLSNRISILEVDQQFHLYMSIISGNEMLRKMLEELFEQFVRIHIVTFRDNLLRMDYLVNDHSEMNTFLQRHDFESYKEAIIRHISIWPSRFI